MAPKTVSISEKVPSLTGHVVKGGEYQLVKKLGKGAYGVIYKAVCLNTSASTKEVAIKILRKDAMNKRDRIHAAREVAFLHTMAYHPNVVTMHGSFEDNEHVYIILDYCSGGDLFGKICEEKVFFKEDKLVKKLFLQLLDAVHACHCRKIYHRDLKPENILVNNDCSQLYLADFGLATNMPVSETFGCGSSYYMSPECIGKEWRYLPYGNRANDVWALGIILINMVTCRSPWTKAVHTDEGFHEFLKHEDYLLHMLPISEGANDLFRNIFTFDPVNRITLPELRVAIKALDTFFMSDINIARGPSIIRATAEYYQQKKAPVGGDRHSKDTKTALISSVATADAFVFGEASLSDDSEVSEDCSTCDESSACSEVSTCSESDELVTPSSSALDVGVAVLAMDDLRLDGEIGGLQNAGKGKNRDIRNPASDARFISVSL